MHFSAIYGILWQFHAFRQQMTAAFEQGFEQRGMECGSLLCFGLHKIIKQETNT